MVGRWVWRVLGWFLGWGPEKVTASVAALLPAGGGLGPGKGVLTERHNAQWGETAAAKSVLQLRQWLTGEGW